MDLINGPGEWKIREQIIEDPATGLSIQFEALPDGEFAIRLFGECIRFGNREFVFDTHGEFAGAGTALVDGGKATWLYKYT